MNPTRGFRIDVDATPYWGHLKQTDKESEFIRHNRNLTVTKGSLRVYIPLQRNIKNFIERDEHVHFIFAGFARSGSIFMKDFKTLPPNKRFYLGGGNSVRGYSLQMLGPLDISGRPIGGRSFAEFGGEGRMRFTETLGGVVFLEGGSVMHSEIPKTKPQVLWGWGIGARYFSQIGPIRLDLAFPSKIRKNAKGKKVDSPFQFYISIGQAF